jgi:hypothetical protein
MRRKTTGWKSLGGLLATCFLAVFVLFPISAATCICADSAIEQVVGASHAIQADHEETDTPCKAACCLGGHCHHAGSMIGAAFTTIMEPADPVAEHAAASVRALTSRPLPTLDRPPRA